MNTGIVTHLITYHSADNRVIGDRMLYDLTDEQAIEFAKYLKKWACALFPNCYSIRIENWSSGDVIKSIGV